MGLKVNATALEVSNDKAHSPRLRAISTPDFDLHTVIMYRRSPGGSRGVEGHCKGLGRAPRSGSETKGLGTLLPTLKRATCKVYFYW